MDYMVLPVDPVPGILVGGRADGKDAMVIYLMNYWYEDDETGDLYEPTGEFADGKLICRYVGHNADWDRVDPEGR